MQTIYLHLEALCTYIARRSSWLSVAESRYYYKVDMSNDIKRKECCRIENVVQDNITIQL